MLSKLLVDQDDLVTLCDRLETVLAAAIPPAPGTLSTLRWQSMRALGQHLAFLETFVLPPLGAAATRIRAAIAQLQREHRAHLARFDALSETSNWDTYRVSARKLVGRTRELIVLERTTLNPIVPAGAELPPLQARSA